MSFVTAKKMLLVAYLAVLMTPGVTWWRAVGGQKIGTYELMRLFGLYGFTLIVVQVAVGSLTHKLRSVFGSGILKWHIAQGLIAFTLVNLHPLFYAFTFGWETLFRSSVVYETWGKIGWLMLTIGVMAGLLRTRPQFMKYWRWIHRVNYLSLVVICYHSWNLGSDVGFWPMRAMYVLAPVVLAVAIYSKIRGLKPLYERKPTTR